MSENSPPPSGRALLTEIARGAQKTFENAEALFAEATLLSGAGAIARALFLHQISLEECAKVDTLCAWAASILAGMPVDEKRVLAGLTRHANKNRTNAYMLEGSAQEVAAKERGDSKATIAAFKTLQNDFHAKSNSAKNASLYVDFEGDEFVAPLDRITEEMLAETAARNETFLGLTFPKLKMLLKWERAPEEAEQSFSAFVRLAESLRAEKPDDVLGASEKLIQAFFEMELARRAAKNSTDEPRA